MEAAKLNNIPDRYKYLQNDEINELSSNYKFLYKFYKVRINQNYLVVSKLGSSWTSYVVPGFCQKFQIYSVQRATPNNDHMPTTTTTFGSIFQLLKH